MRRFHDGLVLSLLLVGSLAACSNPSARYGGSSARAADDPYSFVEPGNGPADMTTPTGVPTDPTEDRNDAGGNGGAGGGPNE